MRKTLICMLAILMLLSSVLVACGGGDSGAGNKPGADNSKASQGLKYKLNEDSVSYSVTGIGSCKDSDVIIPSTHPDDGKPVTTIGRDAFFSCTGLTSVTIPDSVISIGSNAFNRCSKLTSITIGNGVTSIKESAFGGTAYYSDNSNWENDVLYIGKYLIEAKQSISGSYRIKDGTACIAGRAFNNCTRLTGVTIPGSVKSIGNSAFNSCKGLTSVTIPDSVKIIGSWAFYGCSGLASVTIPDSVTSIEWQAFRDCTKLTDIIYNGTKAQWKAIDKDDWKNGSYFFTIYCKDGEIAEKDA